MLIEKLSFESIVSNTSRSHILLVQFHNFASGERVIFGYKLVFKHTESLWYVPIFKYNIFYLYVL